MIVSELPCSSRSSGCRTWLSSARFSACNTYYLGNHLPDVIDLISYLSHLIPRSCFAFPHLLHDRFDVRGSLIYLFLLTFDGGFDGGCLSPYVLQNRLCCVELRSQSIPVLFISGRRRWLKMREKIFLITEL